MSRPADSAWRPLGWDTDPVPGDPGRISQEAAHLASVASTLRAQIGALRKISSDGTEVGEHADKIRSAAEGLITSLNKVEVRYETVAAALSGWVPELENVQNMSVQALNEAEGPYAKLQNTPVPNIPGMTQGLNGQWSLNPLIQVTSAQKTEFASYQQTMNQANSELSGAQALLGRAINLRDTQQSIYAAKINAAISDGLKDSWFERFEDWVESGWDDFTHFVAENAGIIRDICEVLEIVATILAIVAIFVSGGTLLLIIGAILTGIALIGRIMLLASGKGSWLDVLMDFVALVSFGATEWLGKALQGTVDAAKGLAASDFVSDTLTRLAPKLSDMYEAMGSEAGDKILAKLTASLAAKAPETLPEVSEDVSRVERLLSTGDIENVVKLRTLESLTNNVNDLKITEQAVKGFQLGSALTWNFRIATTIGVAGLAGNGVTWEHGDGENGPTVNYQIPGVSNVWSSLESDFGASG
jgi:hypothetical protein